MKKPPDRLPLSLSLPQPTTQANNKGTVPSSSQLPPSSEFSIDYPWILHIPSLAQLDLLHKSTTVHRTEKKLYSTVLQSHREPRALLRINGGNDTNPHLQPLIYPQLDHDLPKLPLAHRAICVTEFGVVPRQIMVYA